MTNRIEDPDQPEDQTEPTIRKVEGGFPHSEILGSKLVRSSPRLIAAYHVLHRLSAPRHPPNALKALDHSHDRCPPRPPWKDDSDAHHQKDQSSDLSEDVCLPNTPDPMARSRHCWSPRLGGSAVGYVPSLRFQTS